MPLTLTRLATITVSFLLIALNLRVSLRTLRDAVSAGEELGNDATVFVNTNNNNEITVMPAVVEEHAPEQVEKAAVEEVRAEDPPPAEEGAAVQNANYPAAEQPPPPSEGAAATTVPVEEGKIEEQQQLGKDQKEDKEEPPKEEHPILNLGDYAALTPSEWEQRPPIHRLDLIKEPFDPSLPRTYQIQPGSPYSYVMMCWLANPLTGGYKAYLTNILVARKLTLERGSTADFNAIFKLDYSSNHTRLPAKEEATLKKLGIKVSYLPKTPEGGNFFVHQLNKFELWNLTQYQRILYLDGDVLPLNNLDYLFDMSTNGILKPNVMLASGSEPANGGFFLLQPSTHAYRELRQIMLTLGPQIGRGKFFKNRTGLFGHTIVPPDKWETTKGHFQGTKFTFHGGHTDQGLLYSYLKYNSRNVTQIFGKKMIHFGPDPNNPKEAIVEKVIPIKVPSDSPFFNITKTNQYPWWPCSCARFASVFKEGKPGCLPPYRDHAHYTGEKKPWKFQKPTDLWQYPEPRSDFYVWWRMVDRLKTEDDISIDFKAGTRIHK